MPIRTALVSDRKGCRMPTPPRSPADHPRAAGPAGISRRTFVGAAAASAAGIVVATARALPARAGTPATFFGSIEAAFIAGYFTSGFAGEIFHRLKV